MSMAARYVVGWHRTGEEPDVEPREFTNISTARDFLRDELRWRADDEPDHSRSNELWRQAEDLAKPSWQALHGTNIDITVGDTTYFMITESDGQQESAVGAAVVRYVPGAGYLSGGAGL